LGAEAAVNIMYKNLTPEQKEERIQEYKDKFSTPFFAASRGYIDEVIRPQTTRKRICDGLKFLRNKDVKIPNKKHDNLPL
jgi:propionyl-CoA carboxylase beta chain